MKCPCCMSKVDFLPSPVDGQPILICSNDDCDWEQHPAGQADPEAELYQQKMHFHSNEPT